MGPSLQQCMLGIAASGRGCSLQLDTRDQLYAGKQLRREGGDNGKSSNGAGSNGNGKQADGAVGIQKGDGVYYINSPEFTGGLGNREVIYLVH